MKTITIYLNGISCNFTTSLPTWIFSFTSNLEQTRTAEPYFNIYDICKIMANAGGVRLLATSLTETHPERTFWTNDAVPGTVRKKPYQLYFWSYRPLRKHITRRGIKIAIFSLSTYFSDHVISALYYVLERERKSRCQFRISPPWKMIYFAARIHVIVTVRCGRD